MGFEPKPTSKDTVRENVWYKQITELDRIDFSANHHSYKTLSQEQIERKFSGNLKHFTIFDNRTGVLAKHSGVMFGLVGQYYVTTKHTFQNMRSGDMQIRWHSKDKNHLGSVNTKFDNSNFFAEYGPELIVLKFPCLPPVLSIEHLLINKNTSYISDGFLFTRQKDGRTFSNQVNRINLTTTNIEGLGTLQVWEYKPQTPTIAGNCGSPLFSNTNFGWTISGFHISYHAKMDRAQALPVLSDIFNLLPNSGLVSPGPVNGGNVSIGNLSDRSTLQYCSTGSAIVDGTLSGIKTGNSYVSSVRKTMINDDMVSLGYENKFSAPPLSNPKTFNVIAQIGLNIQHGVTPGEIQECVQYYSNHVINLLSNEDLENLGVVTQEVAMQGADGVTYIDPINGNTSGGFGRTGKKRRHLELVSEGRYALKPVDKKILQEVEDCYDSNSTYRPPFLRFPKDEALPNSKVQDGLFRMISCGPMVWNTWIRMYFLSFIRLVQLNKFKFNIAVGMVCQGAEWDALYKYLTCYSHEHVIAGDFSKFDCTASSGFILGAFDIIISICKKSGRYSDNEIRKMSNAAYDFAFPTYVSKGDVYSPFGTNSSGNPLTVLLNSLVNLIALLICWKRLNPKHTFEGFFDYVNVMVYGDDNILSVHIDYPWFNHTSIAQCMVGLGFKYTMAEKGAESKPYVNIFDCEFLKRSFRYEEDVKGMMAPLREEAIIKSLMIGVPSTSICEKEQMVCIMSSAMYEFSFHGRKVYDIWKERINFLINKHNLQDYVSEGLFPSWEQYVERYERLSQAMEVVDPLLLINPERVTLG